jgi:hypothetical protein
MIFELTGALAPFSYLVLQRFVIPECEKFYKIEPRVTF